MCKILIVGNSHVAAVRSAWQKLQPEFRGIDISFFAAPLNIFSSFTLSENRQFGVLDVSGCPSRTVNIIKLNSGGYLSRNFNDFDHVVIVGGRWGMPEILKIYSAYLGENGYEPHTNRQSRIETVFLELCRDLVQRYFPQTALFECGHPNMHIIPAPRRSERLLPTESNIEQFGQQRYASGKYLNLCNHNGLKELINLQSALFVQSVEALGMSCHPQLPETIGEFGLTKARFSDAPERLQTNLRVEIDNIHMNSEYGALFLRDFLFQTGLAKR